jgi:predicted O-methyltransferase YrrM
VRPAIHFGLWCLGLAEAQTQTTAEERACLARHALGRTRLVEIGIWHGVTTRVLRAAMAKDGVLYAVDPFPTGRAAFSMQQIIARREVSKAHRGAVVWMRTTGCRAACDYAAAGYPPIDFVFVDGDHSYEGLRGDWESWVPLVQAGGIVALHDSRSSAARGIDGAGSVRFTSEVVLADSRVEFLEAVDTLSVFRLTSVSRACSAAAAGHP